MRLDVLVLSGSPVIHRVIELSVVFRVAIIIGVSDHHAGDTQNMVGSITIIAR